MAGEMYQTDIDQGGEFYEIRKEMEDIGHKAGLVIKVVPFDTYSGPKGDVHNGSQTIGILWSGDDDSWTFVPETVLKLKMDLKPAKLPKNKMITFLKGVKAKFPSHKPFEVLKGDKPSHYQTPKLKRDQNKSLLHLVKSKYLIVECKCKR